MSETKHDRFEPIQPLPEPTEEELARADANSAYWQRPDIMVLMARRDAEDAARAQAAKRAQDEAEVGE